MKIRDREFMTRKAKAPLAALAALAILVVPACSGKGKARPNRYDPCAEMKTEGENLSKLDGEIETLTAERNAASRENDSAKVASLDAKLQRKTDLRRMNQAALEKASRNCDEEMKSLHRYPEPPEHEAGYP